MSIRACLVSSSGKVSLPAVQHRWDLDNGGPVETEMIDLGFGVLTVPKGKGRLLLNELLPRETHARFVATLNDRDLTSHMESEKS